MRNLTQINPAVRHISGATNSALLSNLNVVQHFLPRGELLAVRYGLTGEEHAFYIDKLAEVAETIKTMPKTYGTEDQGNEATVHLHYFKGSSDWYITEIDAEGDGRTQAFGYAVLNGDAMNAEMVYISIETLVTHGAELDLHWTKRSLDLVKEAVAA